MAEKNPIILVGDGGFACGALAWWCLKLKIALISRLKMNACLYDFPPVALPSKRGRKKTKGERLYSFKEMMEMPDLGWRGFSVEGYGNQKKQLKYITAVSLWGADGFMPVPNRLPGMKKKTPRSQIC